MHNLHWRNRIFPFLQTSRIRKFHDSMRIVGKAKLGKAVNVLGLYFSKTLGLTCRLKRRPTGQTSIHECRGDQHPKQTQPEKEPCSRKNEKKTRHDFGVRGCAPDKTLPKRFRRGPYLRNPDVDPLSHVWLETSANTVRKVDETLPTLKRATRRFQKTIVAITLVKMDSAPCF